MTRPYWSLLVFSLLLLLPWDPGSDLRAQKQAPSPKTQRQRKPAPPAPVTRPRAKVAEVPVVSTTPQAPPASLQSPVTESRLRNGLKVLLQESHDSALVSVGCWYRVGSKDDAPGAAGLSNLTRMMSLREVNGFSREQTGRLMRETGGDWKSVTLPDQTGFY